MKAHSILPLCALLIFFPSQGRARWMHYQTKAVPIARVLANLESRLKANTNDVEVLYHLARVHSMAYSTNLQTVPITTVSLVKRETLRLCRRTRKV